jgi:hypothetical protein
MERVQGAQTPYEVYCFRCRVTFPVEARRCLHCGGRLYAPGERAVAGADPALHGPALPPPASEEAEEGAALTVRRFGGLAIWALVALSAILNSLCRG